MKSASRLFAVTLLVGLALRLCLLCIPAATFATKATEPTGDSPEYVRLAANLAQGRAFSQDSMPPYRPDLLRTPVYPLFIGLPMAVFGSSLIWPVLLQLLLSLAVIWLTRKLALEAGLGPVASMLACLLVALSPNLVFYSIKLTTETLFVCLLLAALLLVNRFYALRRWPELLGAGVGCGLLVLTRPIALFLPALLALYVFWKAGKTGTVPNRVGRRRSEVLSLVLHSLKDPLLLLASAAFVVAPWVVRNARASGRYFVTTAFDYNISEYTGALTMAADRLIPVDVARDSLASEAELRFGPLDTNDQARYWAAMACVGWREVRARPLLATEIYVAGSVGGLLMPLSIRALRVFSGQNPPADTAVDPHVAQRTTQFVARGRLGQALALVWRERLARLPALALAILAYAVLFHVTLLVAFVVSLFLKRSRRLLWLLLPILYFVLSTGPVGEARFRVPIEPLLCLFAATALVRSQKGEPSA